MPKDPRREIACEFIDFLSSEIRYIESISHCVIEHDCHEKAIQSYLQKNAYNGVIVKYIGMCQAFALYNSHPDVFRKTLKNMKKVAENVKKDHIKKGLKRLGDNPTA